MNIYITPDIFKYEYHIDAEHPRANRAKCLLARLDVQCILKLLGFMGDPSNDRRSNCTVFGILLPSGKLTSHTMENHYFHG